ncbi:long-chain-fatty-acid--CoA ligase 4 isoform X3 [Ostrinia nubilalis]
MFIDENETPESWWVSAVLKTIRAVALVCDIITFPIHLLLQRPWRKRALSRRIKARIIDSTSDTVTVRSVCEPCELHVRMVRDGVGTMEAMLRAAAARYAARPSLGTRTVLSEEDEPQPNGRVFKKFNMGDYVWRTYTDVEREARHFGAGLRELGCRPRHNLVMFAETRAEWMVAAHGCFKQSIPVVTIYATLGDEAIAHGINETEVSTVITTHELLPKFRKILAKTPRVDTIVFMEDQLQKTDRDGFKPGIRIVAYKEVVEMGANSKIETVPPSPSDTAIVMYTSGSTGVPKGVVLSHRNMIATLKSFADAVPIREDDILMGFLPLAHVFELLAESICIIAGVPIGYSTALTMLDSSNKIMKGTKGDATTLQPTCLTTVPLILDRVSKGITDKVSKSGEFAGAFFRWAYSYKQAWMRRGYDTPILNQLMFSKVRGLLGGRLRLLLSGGAPLSPDTHAQLRICLCCDVVTGYGLTETTSCATVMDFADRYGTVPTSACAATSSPATGSPRPPRAPPSWTSPTGTGLFPHLPVLRRRHRLRAHRDHLVRHRHGLRRQVRDCSHICLCCDVVTGYGLTETTSCATVMDFADRYGTVPTSACAATSSPATGSPRPPRAPPSWTSPTGTGLFPHLPVLRRRHRLRAHRDHLVRHRHGLRRQVRDCSHICLCCDVVTGYGLTETTSCATVMDFADRSTGRVGAPTTGTDIKLVNWEEGNYRVTNKPFPQGEIVIGGESVAEGYYKNPEKTKEEFVEADGMRWFKSGDIGELHHDGCIKIIDRKKDLVKLQAGEYVSLGKVEAELKTCALVENICVYGDSTKTYTVALVVPHPQRLQELAAREGLPPMEFEQLCRAPAVEKAALRELADHALKCGLERFEVPLAVKLVTEVWSPDMGLVTAAFKIKRKDIQERYKDDIKRMYAS